MVGQHLAELFDPAHQLRFSVPDLNITRQDELRNIADATDGRSGLFGVDRIAQAQDIGVGCDNAEPAAALTVFYDGAVDKDPFMSTSGSASAVPDKTCEVCRMVNSAR